MSSIEGIVRPFKTPVVAPSRAFQVGVKPAPPLVIIQSGRGGGGRVLNGNFSNSESFYMTQYDNEKSQANWGTVD